VLIDDEKEKISYSGAGDLPLLKYEKNKDNLISYQSEGILLGFSEEGFYNEIELEIKGEEELFLVTDGIIDFEVDGVKKSDMNMLKHKLHDLKERNELTENIVHNLFNKHTSQIDDCSIIIIKRKEHE